MRLFIGVELLGDAKELILSVRERLMAAIDRQGVRFVRPEKLHVTLAFLGSVDESKVAGLVAALDQFAGTPGMALVTGPIGCFPDMRRPRVIWIGLGGDIDRLATLAAEIASTAKPLSPELGDEPFKPHVTLARINPGSKEVGRVIHQLSLEPAGAALRVDSFTLFHSRPDGTYEKLHEVKLQHV